MSTSPSRAVESVIRNADFVRLWTAETISQFGTQVSLLAIPLVAVSLVIPLVITPVRTLRDMPRPAGDPSDPAAGVDGVG